ncbi:MAG: alpha/beta fold hydrolase [Acidimicrobiia bacterium]|nr:alpha/beta fold hydrolase [Acidimicrobiia bacterium]
MSDPRALVESLLAAKLYLSPQIAGDKLYFVSNRTGHMSLFAMPLDGGETVQLVPEDLALPSPKIMGAESFSVLPDVGKILVTIDDHGDENYQPYFIPIEGGTPEPIWGDRFAGQQVLSFTDRSDARAILIISPRTDPNYASFLADLTTLALTELGTSPYGNFPIGRDEPWETIAVVDGYTAGDTVLYLWEAATRSRRHLAGVPLEERGDDPVPAAGFTDGHVRDDAVLLMTTLFTDTGGLCTVGLDGGDPVEVPVTGLAHDGIGELTDMDHLDGDRYELHYNIDGCSYGYEATFENGTMAVTRVLWGTGELGDGVVQASSHDAVTDTWAIAFSTATSPVQLYTVGESGVRRHTDEAIDGLSTDALSPGEDASFVSHDGTRVSARLYLPAPGVGEGPYPVIYYVHGGPQSQERPDFTWFSIPLIQLFTLHGFAVFVPNARGSSGYGQAYMKRVDRDWGGADRLDHAAGVEMLRQDHRLDGDRIGVMGRSYGGFMTLTLLGRHPDLWAAGVDMFGPYDLFTFLDALPETWKTYMYLAIGHPETDRDFLIERSPRTHLDAMVAPLLVIQGRNDPRVVVAESDRLVDELQSKGKDIEYLVFDDEGHDMVKHENKVTAYVAILEFFQERLGAL